jgi:hypothetical protein
MLLMDRLRCTITFLSIDCGSLSLMQIGNKFRLLSGPCVQKEKKRCRVTRIEVGAEGSEPTLGKTVVSRGGGNTLALWSLTQETLTTILLEI